MLSTAPNSTNTRPKQDRELLPMCRSGVAATLVLPDTPSRQSLRNRSEESHEALCHRTGDPRRQRPQRGGTGGDRRQVQRRRRVPRRAVSLDHQLRRGRQDLLRARGGRRRRDPRARPPRRISRQQRVRHRQRVRSAHRRVERGVAVLRWRCRGAQRYRVSTATLSMWWVSGKESNTRSSSTR